MKKSILSITENKFSKIDETVFVGGAGTPSPTHLILMRTSFWEKLIFPENMGTQQV